LSWGEGGILASRFNGLSRDIVIIDPDLGTERTIIEGAADERDPHWDAEGSGFLYSSDRTGIFNVYHHRIEDGVEMLVTNCIGGAFSPRESGGDCIYSLYGPDGYEIRRLSNWRGVSMQTAASQDDPDLMENRIACIGAESPKSAEFVQEDEAVGESLRIIEEEKFGFTYTPLFIFPRFLIYEKKPRLGVFLSSMDLLDRINVSAGASMNADREFDLQIGMELRRFKPTFMFEVYRSRKYYDIRSTIGNEPFEYTTRYDLWDAFFTCRLEFSRPTFFHRNDLSLVYNHGEYGLNISPGEVPGIPIEIGWTYYKGNELSLLYNYKKLRREVDGDINPRKGRICSVEMTAAYNKLDSGQFEYGFLPIYDKNTYGRFRVNYEEFIPLPFWRHSLSFKAIGGVIDDEVDDFFYLYLGSRDGLRGYSYYSMGGRKMALGRVTYRFPLLGSINRQILHVYLSSIYIGLFAEAGKAWSEDEFDLRGNKKDVGYEIRLKGFTFYNYPLAATFEAAYGLNDVEYNDPFNDQFTFYEGNSWKYYGSILFNF
jgi:hypothetical protein